MWVVEWQTPEPERDATWLATLFGAAAGAGAGRVAAAAAGSDGDDRLSLGPSARLLVVPAGERAGHAGGAARPSRDRSLAIRADDPGPTASASASRLRLLGVGWACVDEGRAVTLAGDAPAPADEPLLGAAGFRGGGDPATFAWHPVAEGRLAASLARGGEGPVALYLEVPGATADLLQARLGGAGAGTVRGAGGPFEGSAVLVRPDRPWGPFLIFAARSAARGPSAAGYR